MSNVSLFRKWRSQSFADLVGQEAVLRTLRNVLSSGSPGRAYLFCGPRGTGKTSTARIFAKALNCRRGPSPEPCNECDLCRRITDGSCLDVQEIDAASHTQVEKIREFIVEKVHFAPVEATYKVYIIDEVHKLSVSSFNALLKTLEEPPPHVVFILATTHPHELLPTILSRCQRHDFRPLSLREIRGRLEQVSAAEGIVLERGAAEHLARAAEGSLRDALVLLEQAVAYCGARVGEAEVRQLLGLAGPEVMGRLVEVLRAGDARAALELLHRLAEEGRDLGRLAGEFLEHLRRLLLLAARAADPELLELSADEAAVLQAQVQGLTPARIMQWLRAFMDLTRESRDPARGRLLWELALVRLTLPEVDGQDGLAARVARLEERLLALPAAAAHPEEPTGSPGGSRPQAAPSRRPPEAASSESGPPPSPSRPPTRTAPPAASQGQAGGSRREAAPSRQPPEAAPSASGPPPSPPRPPAAAAPPAAPFRPSASPGGGGGSPRPAGPPEAPARPTPPEPAAGNTTPTRTPPVRPGKVPADLWPRILARLREKNKSLQAILADARLAELGEERLVLAFPESYNWHREKTLESRALLEQVCSAVLERPVRVECVLGGQPPASAQDEHQALVQRASQLFSGRIMEE